MGKMLRLGGSVAVWILLWALGDVIGGDGLTVSTHLGSIYFTPVIGIVISVVSVIWPAIVDMGVAKYKKANLYERIFPLLVVAILLYMSTWFTPTIIIALINSYYLGVGISYLFKVIASQLGWEV